MATDTAQTDRRARLLEGLTASLREKGLARTQIGDIVRHARTSNRAFYECFPDKESAFVALIREGSIGIFQGVEALLDSDAHWEEMVDVAVDGFLRAITDDPVRVAAMSRELPGLGAQGAALHREAIDRFADLIVRMSHTDRVRAAGVGPVDRDTAVLMIGGVGELVARAQQDGRPFVELAPTVKAVIKAVGRAR